MTLVDADTGEVVVVAPDSLTFSEDNYGRDSVDKSTVDDYAEALRAGAEFPPIEVYADGEIAGGVHRWHAHSEEWGASTLGDVWGCADARFPA